MAECSHCVQETIKAFNGIDVVICNAGWTRFSDFNDLDSMSDEEWDKCWHTNVLGVKRYVMEALPTFKHNPEGGVVIITSSIAAQKLGGSSMPYCVTKAAQVHVMKCIAASQGEKLRINAVLPGLLLTDWGNRYGDEAISNLKEAAALKKEVCTPVAELIYDLDTDSLCCRLKSATVRTCTSRLQKTPQSPGRTSLLVSPTFPLNFL